MWKHELCCPIQSGKTSNFTQILVKVYYSFPILTILVVVGPNS